MSAIIRSVMAREPLFAWSGKEYEFAEKSSDWYWALGIVAAGIVIACIIFGNILLALVTVSAAGAVGVAAAKRSSEHAFSLDERGLTIDDRLYHFDTMLHFSVLEYPDQNLPPALSIKTRSILTPHLLVPLAGVDADAVYDFVSLRLSEGRHDESLLDRLVDTFQL